MKANGELLLYFGWKLGAMLNCCSLASLLPSRPMLDYINFILLAPYKVTWYRHKNMDQNLNQFIPIFSKQWNLLLVG